MEKLYHGNTCQKKIPKQQKHEAVLKLGKTGFIAKNITGDNEAYSIMIKWSDCQKNITMLNIPQLTEFQSPWDRSW